MSDGNMAVASILDALETFLESQPKDALNMSRESYAALSELRYVWEMFQQLTEEPDVK